MNHQIRWTDRKIERRLQLITPLVYRQQQPLPPFRFTAMPDASTPPPVQPEVDDSAWEVINPGDYWGGWLCNYTLRSSFQVPADWSGPAALFLPLGEAGDFSHPEALVYIDGQACGSCDRHHQELRLPDFACDGQPHTLALHGWTGLFNGDPLIKLLMRPCMVVELDPATRRFITRASAALTIAKQLAETDTEKGRLLSALDEAFNLLDTREPFGAEFYASLPTAAAALDEGLAQAGAPLDVDIEAVGHAHIDVAWLWTLDQTRQKARRTFHNAVRLMELYPAFKFSQSQPQLYDFVRQDDPALFETIRQRAVEGRWEVMGGMWVEADCNLSGPESLARQFLLGRSFFRQHFGPGADSPVLWLPDVFGYAWNLPQLIREAGCRFFFTIKIGWSQYNRLPWDSFYWQGLDGTRVLTHFSPTPEKGSMFGSTYNADASPDQILGTWTNYKQKDWNKDGRALPMLMSYGYGDGGGGPTREMVENVDTFQAFPAAPRTHFSSVRAFFERLEETAGGDLPVWNGELYLEYHRGTYTTQGRNKRANREAEFLLHDADFLSAMAARMDAAYAAPRETLRKGWEVVCLNQFHDILPGSSIGPVYWESQAQYAEVRELCAEVSGQALASLAGQTGGAALAVNPSAFTRSDLIFFPGAEALPALARPDGTPVAAQPVAGGVLLDAGPLPPFSVTPLCAAPEPAVPRQNTLQASPTLLENDLLRVELNADGDITRLLDKRCQREVLPAGALANQLQAFEDRPMNFDAWDVDIYYEDRMWLADPAVSITVIEAGPLRAALEIKRRILHSTFTQVLSLEAGSARLDVDTRIDWSERHILLKAAFPVDVFAPAATYEIQWGNVTRPTHRNTSWDWARFETCAQKWVDLSEGDYGVSLLNNGKYGHDIHDGVLRISLLRSPTMPDFDADQGEHSFKYSLLPHAGSWGAGTISQAYAINDPLRLHLSAEPAPLRQVPPPFIQADRDNVVIETIKPAEDGRGVIVRLYECQRQRGPLTLRAGFPLAGAWRCNLLEEDQEALPCADQAVQTAIRPYQILTLRLLPA
ncbi:MAG TPA: glycoside hydrolase family 38 C-terminal domain-containing protein [Anaerolineaceae bacterium]|nr:glycoside hydrolase family 38 C-terminal domain-containing protein [Anaerolineaceae bacterium]HPN51869.1 glycoside hydrolase family 38 C-terminal domain-containing protein [Anaerolineaceae bacterium]